MKQQGEFIFKSFEEARAFVDKPTNYEQENNITLESSKIVLSIEDLKVIKRKTSDNQESIFIFFKNSIKYDVWKFWCPTKTQLKMFATIQALYEVIDYQNKKVGGCTNTNP